MCCITRRWNLYAMLPQFSVFFSAAVLKIFGMKDVPLELLPVGHMESFLEIEQFGESHSTINRLLGALS